MNPKSLSGLQAWLPLWTALTSLFCFVCDEALPLFKGVIVFPVLFAISRGNDARRRSLREGFLVNARRVSIDNCLASGPRHGLAPCIRFQPSILRSYVLRFLGASRRVRPR